MPSLVSGAVYIVDFSDLLSVVRNLWFFKEASYVLGRYLLLSDKCDSPLRAGLPGRQLGEVTVACKQIPAHLNQQETGLVPLSTRIELQWGRAVANFKVPNTQRPLAHDITYWLTVF